ncbi:rod shape-determining protein MreD [Sagittula salina]|uniref:Rod shape-determining protein MreD n=1 Tax=Sagittula salina TaxID=2820268 RepID=A0A940MGS2_9RHOB|nr:rod shape-determining protein MreD [Sagittula salina]MBP0481435.1 rod shape-determining protein MreD [Sagittula salina]
MAENGPARLWAMRAAYPALAMAIIFVHLLPLQMMPARFAGPDWLTVLTFAWCLRRPDYVPALSIALVMLLADLLFQRPPALWALLVLLASEFLKSRGRQVRENTFFAEWLAAAMTLLVITLLYRLTLAILIISPGMLSLTLMQYGMTVAAYPVVAALSYLVFGVRRSTPGEYDHTGRSL